MMREWLNKLRLRAKGLAKRKQLDRDLEDEVAFHLAMRERKNRDAGLIGEEARYAARRQFGNSTSVREGSRELWTFAWVETLWQDLRFGARMLRKNLAFTATAILTLALGIGANTAIFSMVNGLILRPLPVRDPQQLTFLGFPRGGGNFDNQFSYPEFVEIRRETADLFDGEAAFIFGGLSGFENVGDGLTVNGKTESVQTIFVTGNFFAMMGLQPARGRLILPAEGFTANADPVVVLSYRYWQSRFHGDDSIVGSKAIINGHPIIIVGVAPEGFEGPTPLIAMQAYLPLGMATVDSGGATNFLSDPKMRSLLVLARLKPGTTSDRVGPVLSLLGQRLFQENPRPEEASTLRAIPLRPPAIMNPPDTMSKIASLFLVLAGLVLILACVNVANLLLVRAAARQREMAVRTALGAGRGRLIRQLLTESLLLAVVACGAGLTLGLNATRAIAALPLETELPFLLDFRFDWRVFAYAFGVALLTGALVGTFPALRVARGGLNSALHERGSTSTGGRQHLRRVLVAIQIGGSLTLLITAGLFLRSLASAQKADLGFDPRNVLNLTLDPNQIGYNKTQGIAFYKELLGRVRAVPGVESASVASTIPLGETAVSDELDVPGYQSTQDQSRPSALYTSVSPGNFRTMGIPILRGRDFRDADDENAPRVAVINQAMAEKFWPNQDPLGKEFKRTSDKQHTVQIVGVVHNTRLDQLYGPFEECFYVPFAQNYASSETLQVRTFTAPTAAIPTLLGLIETLAPTMPVFGVRTMTRALHGLNGLLLFEIGAGMAAALGFLGLALAIVGVYGVTSYSVSQRTSEIGIRMALGARPAQVLAMICRQGLLLIAAGLTLGLIAAFAVGRLAGDFLVGVTSNDPTTYIGVSTLLAGVALLASYLPAKRATRIDPMVALRHE